MFESLKRFLFDRGRDADVLPALAAADEKQLAEAALMFHVIAADGIITRDERQRMSARLEKQFGITTAESAQLIEMAHEADNEAIDLYGFTSTLKRGLERERLLEIVANLWEMVYADGVVHEVEDNIVWRIADLLGIDSQERIELKRKVRETRL